MRTLTVAATIAVVLGIMIGATISNSSVGSTLARAEGYQQVMPIDAF